LQEWLGPAVEVRVKGICGELTGEMAMRFRRDVLEHRPEHVVILGGTNDLGWNGRPDDIMRNLTKMYELARASGIVPLNELIQDYAVSKHLAWVDLFTATADPETHQLAAPYSNDGLHLTTAGYRLLAGLLCDRVFTKAVADDRGRTP
jgi:lysophospholipase L1-like esterase